MYSCYYFSSRGQKLFFSPLKTQMSRFKFPFEFVPSLFHHPDLLMSPSKCTAEPDVTRRKSPSDQLNGGRKSPFLQTNPSSIHRKSKYSKNDQSPVPGSSVDSSPAGGSWRYVPIGVEVFRIFIWPSVRAHTRKFTQVSLNWETKPTVQMNK